MKKLLSLLSLIFPLCAFSSSGSLSFAPPPGDYSVVFLGNIFGIVDGVLHGTGSQMLGNLFGVFNAAVLALGGIIIMYTLLVSTMNTAHEGQMLGQKWSSIWVPLRSTLGLALLIPKASGYCLMQIFVMWVVVQGVGAADKVWASALSYLNRGGVIIQTQMKPNISMNSSGSGVANAAATILSGQVCMLGLQTILQNQRQRYLNEKQAGTGKCSGNPSKAMQIFCNTPVPDFLSTVNFVSIQSTNLGTGNFTAVMPSFPPSSPYAFLNGVCGSISWKGFTPQAEIKDPTTEKLRTGWENELRQAVPTMSNSELQTAWMSRAIGIQQIYVNLANVAQVMVNNNPEFNPTPKSATSQQQPFSKIAMQQFGVPYTNAGRPCTGVSENCTSWGPDPSGTSAPLFSGTEFQGAIADYNNILLPTLNLLNQAKNKDKAQTSRLFIQKANSQGWIMAGSYFFELARLNAREIEEANRTDADSGLGAGTFDLSRLTSSFKKGSSSSCTDEESSSLCVWFAKEMGPINNVIGLIDGSTILTAPVPAPKLPPTGNAIADKGSSTVYGFISNSAFVELPGQPGLKPPQFLMKINAKIDFGQFLLKPQTFPCGELKIGLIKVCIGQIIGDVFYNFIILGLLNFFLNLAAPIVSDLVMAFLSFPLEGISQIFRNGIAIIQQPTVNPVVAMANMGVTYINFANELWVYLIGVSVTAAFIPIFNFFIFPLVMLSLPLLTAWLGIVQLIGFLTAYYIPLLPYMIFTFGSIAWLIAVIEAMVAAPIVALGVTHPEGHDAFGKGEQAIMILMNVFLRPALMVIGYITAIALSYVGVWIMNAGFQTAAAFIQGQPMQGFNWSFSVAGIRSNYLEEAARNLSSMSTGYSGWAGIYGFFFALLIYTTMYLIIIHRSFTLITYLPDKVLRWIGGQPESIGQEAAQWGEEARRQVESGAKDTSKAAAQIDQQLGGIATRGVARISGVAAKQPPKAQAQGNQVQSGPNTQPPPQKTVE